MTLVLSTLRCPDKVAPETRRVTGGEFTVGRGPDNDWVLPDPDRHLSKRHCVFAFRSGGWQVADTSTNGTFFNRESQPIGDGAVRELRDGDRVTFGPYEIEIRVEAAASYSSGSAAGFSGGFSGAGAGGQRGGADPFASPFAENVFAPPQAPPPPFGEDPLLAQKHAPGPAHLPADFDPFATPSRDEGLGFPTQADHSPAFGDAFRPPKTVTPIPDDWDFGIGTPSAPPAQSDWSSGAPQATPHAAPEIAPQAGWSPVAAKPASPADPFGFGAPVGDGAPPGQQGGWSGGPSPAVRSGDPFDSGAPQGGFSTPAQRGAVPAGDPFGADFGAPANATAGTGQTGQAAAGFGQALAPGGMPPGGAPPSADRHEPSVFGLRSGQTAVSGSPFDAAPSHAPDRAAPSTQAQPGPFTSAPFIPGPVMPTPMTPSGEAGAAFAAPAPPSLGAASGTEFGGGWPPQGGAQATPFGASPPGLTPPGLAPLDPVPVKSGPSPSTQAGSPFEEPGIAPVAVTQAPAAASATEAAAGDLLAAFLHGAGMAGARPTDPTATMLELGRAFRALVAGLRETLIARAAIKGEFRIEQTMIRSRGNNPLKFSAGDDDALAALLGIGRRVDMAPSAAVGDALRDIRMHELASMSAMQTAVRALLARLDPEPLRRQADAAGGLAVMPAQKKARAWDAFETLHGQIAEALSDDFDSVFGKAFARAYEQALEDVARAERKGGAG